MPTELDEFLAQGRPESEPAPAPEPGRAEPRPTTEQAPQPESAPPPEKPAEPDPEDAEPEAQHDGAIPRVVYDAERRGRRDWKEKAIRSEERASRYETEATELRKQLDEAKRVVATPAAPPPPPFQLPDLPDFATDPQGYIHALSARHEFNLLNQKLNDSEERLRDKIGDEKTDEYKAEFMKLAEADETLKHKAFAARNPFAFVVKEVDKVRHFREVGDDPTAFQDKLRAKLRAEWEAEAAARQPAAPPPSPVAGQQPSLAGVRSSAPRSAPGWSGEPSLDDVVRSIQTRKQRNGHA